MNQMALSSSSIQLAHNLAMHFSNVVFEYSVDLPEFVSDKICRFCSSFLVPSLTSTIRLVKRKKGKDEILSTCLACNRVTKRVQKPHMKKKCSKRKADIVNNGKDDVNNVKKNKSFSFLDKSSGGSGSNVGTLSGDFIALPYSSMQEQRQQSTSTVGCNLLEMEREKKRKKKDEKRKQRTQSGSSQVSSLKSLKDIFSGGIKPTFQRYK